MNELMNNTLVQQCLEKLGTNISVGTESWIKYIQIKYIYSLTFDTLLSLLFCFIFCKNIKCALKDGDENIDSNIRPGRALALCIVSLPLFLLFVSDIPNELAGALSP